MVTRTPATLPEKVTEMQVQIQHLFKLYEKMETRQEELTAENLVVSQQVKDAIEHFDTHLEKVYASLKHDILGYPKEGTTKPSETSLGGRIEKIERILQDVILSLKVVVKVILGVSAIFAFILAAFKEGAYLAVLKMLSIGAGS